MRRARPGRGAGPSAMLRPLLAGTLLLGSIGSCELPKPQIPSIGAAPAAPAAPPAAPVAASAAPAAPVDQPAAPPAQPAATS